MRAHWFPSSKDSSSAVYVTSFYSQVKYINKALYYKHVSHVILCNSVTFKTTHFSSNDLSWYVSDFCANRGLATYTQFTVVLPMSRN